MDTYAKEQYNKDIQFVRKIDGMLERRLDHTAYVFWHICFMCFFFHLPE